MPGEPQRPLGISPGDAAHGARLAPQRRDLDQGPARVLGVESDAVVAVLEQQLAAAAMVGVDDLDRRDLERRVAAHQDLADRVGLARADADPARVDRAALERVQAAALADALR